MKNDVIYSDELRKKLRDGFNKVADSVALTLGAKGRNVIIDKNDDLPVITKDGVTVARSIFLKDQIEAVGARLIKDVAHKTNEQAGDGTTTATVIARYIFNEGMRLVAAGSDPMLLKRGIDKTVVEVVKRLKELAVPIGDVENIRRIATISANGDTTIGDNIAGAIQLVSKDGVITIADGTGLETTIDVTEGMQYNKGYLSPYFVTNQAKMEVVFDNPYILLCGKKISFINEVLRALELSVEDKRPLLIITDEIDGPALQTLILNKLQGVVQVCACKSPNYGAMRRDMIQDIAILTGGLVIDENAGLRFEDLERQNLGQASKVIVTNNTTTIIGGKGDQDEIKQRIELIREQVANMPTEYDVERVKERLAKMAGGVAVISVGGTSEVDMRERKDRFEDALNATRAAIDEGIVPGGGVALLRCLDVVVDKLTSNDEHSGVMLMLRALKSPFQCIMKNANLPVDVIFEQVTLSNTNVDFGYNVNTGRYEQFFETGVIDPVKVTRIALENAASVSGLLLTAESLVYNLQETKND